MIIAAIICQQRKLITDLIVAGPEPSASSETFQIAF